jgi:hypothetical protein
MARCYAPIHQAKGDRNARRAFDEVLRDPGVRGAIDKQGTKHQLLEAEAMWQGLMADPQLKQIKHFRDKSTAHLADTIPGVDPPSYSAFFDFARRTARLLEKLAHDTGCTRE